MCFDRNLNLKIIKFSDGGHLIINESEELIYAENYGSTFIKSNKFENEKGKAKKELIYQSENEEAGKMLQIWNIKTINVTER